jgi:hypothetical protein
VALASRYFLRQIVLLIRRQAKPEGPMAVARDKDCLRSKTTQNKAGAFFRSNISAKKKARAHQPLSLCALFKLSRKVSSLLASI